MIYKTCRFYTAIPWQTLSAVLCNIRWVHFRNLPIEMSFELGFECFVVNITFQLLSQVIAVLWLQHIERPVSKCLVLCVNKTSRMNCSDSPFLASVVSDSSELFHILWSTSGFEPRSWISPQSIRNQGLQRAGGVSVTFSVESFKFGIHCVDSKLSDVSLR